MVDFAKHKQSLLCNDPQSIADYEKNMATAISAVGNWLKNNKMYTGGSIKQLREEIAFQPSEQGFGLEKSLDRLTELFLNKSLKVHHPHSLAHLHCPTMLASQVAEVFINATNQSMDSWDQSPAGSLMEVQLIEWLREKVGYAAGDAGVFTSGGTQSNLMGVLLARDACVAKHWKNAEGKEWSVQQDGLPAEALQRVKVLCSENAHFSVQKNMAMMGMGFQSVVSVPCNENAQMDVNALAEILANLKAEGKLVACIVATAGTTDAGAIDPLKDIRKLADQYDAWLHVDAAWGGALLLSNEYRHWLDGLELADSVTLDFHKHFFQSISCGAFLLKDPQNYRFIDYKADYLNSEYDEEHGVPNLVAKSLQTTRRFDALKLWFTVEALGEELYGSMIDHGVKLTREVADYIKATEGLELLVEPQFASVLFRVNPANYPAEFIDNLNQNIADELFARGEANIGVTKVNGVQALKMTTLSPIATLENVQALLAQVLETADNIKDAIVAGNYVPAID
ncbi:pyridoxal phosphate-dependent decarboxylase family protein [Avibacterium paragallinarum]|uniref:Aspartate aminotransferase family protein n=1 Tax=Avibacterium paragallinarum TaxID=728 RepID=A0A0F5F2D7_AVIPA|nr:aspartate aminotransferase family protein [Avibacterium paragallinarum]KAA6209038.1 aspartate aminotransferase family protein [Avibacterium paragallinarum]KKB02362.1 2,4-diaminobutyrate decarboxylase [Avibacterium paragallinarum]RZN60904.1 aspartate aminotransferase family protein [Avibacterium paragallinarum]RZN73023.1 aspartate aminotransferase family protein [Avibacterium paragallinarum]SUV40672.1 L-2,4-diaminobutyrate decarboxylase [Avibacterium paragallinarum]